MQISNEGEDYASVVFTPGQDDSFEVSGYGSRSGVNIKIPLYSHEVKELIDLLSPLYDRLKEGE